MRFVDETRRHGFAHRRQEGDFLARLTAAERRQIREDHGEAGGVADEALGLPRELFWDHWFAEWAVEFLREHQWRRIACGRRFCSRIRRFVRTGITLRSTGRRN